MISISMDNTWATLAGRIVGDGFQSILDEAAQTARDTAPVRGGTLRASIESFISGGLDGGIVARAAYASFVNDGTGIYGPAGRPFAINPVRRKALYWPGARHPVVGVTNPGQPANPFMSGAVLSMDIDSALQKTIDE